MSTIDETVQLAQLMYRKQNVLIQLREFGRRQIQMITEGEISSLLRLLSDKQKFLTQIQQIEIDLNPFRSQDPESRNWQSAQHRQRIIDVANRCETLLAEIMLIERQSEASLASRRDATAARLRSVTVTSQPKQNYVHTPVNTSGRLDVCQ